MDLTSMLLRAGAARPHVLIAAMPGGTEVRLAAEEQLRRRGWPAALTPADADVLLTAGTPGAHIADAVEATWAAVPAPRARAHATRPGEAGAALDAARAEIAGAAGQRLAAPAGGPGDRHDAAGHDGHDMTGTQDAMGGHHGHGMSGGHHGDDMGAMGMPAGLPMAERGEDRDGLKLDQLHVPLGPLLPDWPAGLVVRVMLQGDVVQHAEAAGVGLGERDESFWAEPWRRAAAGEPVTAGAAARRRAAARLDSLGRFLAVAGWGDAATVARRLRDETLGGGPAAALRPAVCRLAARVSGSRVLAWSTLGMGVLPPDGAATVEPPGGPALWAAGDVTVRYRRWCRDLVEMTALLDDDSLLDASVLTAPHGGPGDAQALLALLPRLLEGAELAAARLIVASLDPDLDALAAPVAAGHDH